MRRTQGGSWPSRVAGMMLAGALIAPLGMSSAFAQTEPPPPEDEAFDALVFSKTSAFRHSSIETGIAAIEALGAENGFSVDTTEDAGAFTAANLAQYDVVVWLSTTGDVLDADQQAAFEDYIRSGGGYAGVHAASDTEYDWSWYGDLVGAYFSGHPANQDATVVVEDPAHPSTAHLPAEWDRYDEWYSFRDNPRGDVHVLASLDEDSYDPGGNAMGDDHPIAWCQDFDGGRSWYTAGGHTNESYGEPGFREHLLKGLQTAAGVVPADCSASLDASFEKVPLDLNTQNPMDVSPTPDGRAVYLERDGRVQIVQADGGTVTAGTLAVTQVQEFGLLGIELDPDFAENGWIYLYYSPQGSETDRVARFTLEGNTLDLNSEKVLLEVPVQRDECCHAGGALEFDGEGNLYIALGDNTNPFASDGYTPIDERDGRAAWDAQRTSGNTNDLRGKVLRITPQDDGSYTIPDGNLFEPGTELTRPEIYAMGFRNPFKIGIDPRTDTLLVADYGPDAGSNNPNRGPAATVEWNALTQPGNYGWPLCVGPNTPYNDYDFATGTSGATFDCENGPTNDSPHNTGLTTLPPAIPATIWYRNNGSESNAPEIGNGGAPMAGGVYVYDETSDSERKWPAYWDGKAMFGEWNTNKLFSFQLSDDSSKVLDINEIFTSMSFARPHALEWGADGALYVIEWGGGFGGNNADSGLYRIDYVSGNRSPIARIASDVTSGPIPLEVTFSADGSRDPDGGEVTYAWDFGDGSTSTEANPTHTYTGAGNYTATLTVTDPDEKSTSATLPITAGNTAPVIDVEFPANGGFFNFGDVVRYKVSVTDPEDGEIDCDNVIVQPALGHDEHAHPADQFRGCEGAIPVEGDQGHIGANIFGVLTVTYTDQGADGVDPLTTQEIVILQPKRKEAEFFSDTGRLPGSTSTGDPGVQTEDTSDVGGGLNIGYAEVDDWFSFDPTNLTGIDAIRVRGASDPGGTIDIRTGAPDGQSLGTVTIPDGDWQGWGDYDLDLPADVTTETGPLYFVITAGQANVNWVEFLGTGVTDNSSPVVEVETSATTGTAPLTVDFTATGSDPDGDTPLTYSWDFGDGSATVDTAAATHTYTRPGEYAATVTVTDTRGATTSRGVAITARPATLMCFAGRSDDFTGDALDTGRWDGVVRGNQELRIEDGSLIIPTSSTDIYGTGNSGTPNLVLQDLPEGPFTATTKVTMPGTQAYQQAGLLIYGDDDNYAKMVFQARDTASPNADSRIFQYIVEENGDPREVDDSNTADLGADYPTTVWVRFISDGESLNAAYSADGVTFTEMPETKSIAGIDNPRIGLVSLQGGDRPQAPVEAAFDYFTFTPDDTVPPVGPDDEFDGTALDGCRWDVVRPDYDHLRVIDGRLELDALTGDIYGTDNSGTGNFVLQDAPEGDWTVETLVDADSFSRQYEQAGLIAYVDDDNYVKLDVLATSTEGSAVTRNLELRSEIGGVVQDPQPSQSGVDQGVWHLRLQKEGTTLTGSYSADGEAWTQFESVTNADVANIGRVGLFTLAAGSTAQPTATFDYFRVVDGDPEPPAEVLTETAVTTRCVAGRQVLVASVTNVAGAPLDVSVETAFGTRSVAGLADGATKSLAFTTRSVAIDAGELTVDAAGDGLDGQEVLAYEATSCS
ncbi:ThuA domain-containing protein [Pseudactinotalea sp. HY160]|uniref:ThuA domain-containing protein n=1 Tax=Pseudactinotalea sp. HY160 TaxID=2654490 RepID=UPI00351B7AA1